MPLSPLPPYLKAQYAQGIEYMEYIKVQRTFYKNKNARTTAIRTISTHKKNTLHTRAIYHTCELYFFVHLYIYYICFSLLNIIYNTLSLYLYL